MERALPRSIPPIFALALVALAVFLLAIFLVVPNCSGKGASQIQQQPVDLNALTSSDPDATPSSQYDFDLSEPHQARLVKLLGQEVAAKLMNRALSNVDALWIAAHVDAYAFDGASMQYKAIKLAADEGRAVPFVRNYPAKYPAASPQVDDASDETDASQTVPDDASQTAPEDADASQGASERVEESDDVVPMLYQWDERWAYTGFANTALGLTGSGPACLAMVYQGLTGDASKSPYDMAQMAQGQDGAVVAHQGMQASYFPQAAASLNLECSEVYPLYETIREALLTGQVVVLDIEPGRFTDAESYVVLAGLTGDGKAIMHDPFSVEHSSRLWDLDELASYAKAMYAFWT